MSFKSLACSEHLLLVAAVLAMPDVLCAFLLVYKLMEKLIVVHNVQIVVQHVQIMVQHVQM